MENRIIIGIDSGSATVSVAALDEHGNLAASAYDFHRGKVADTLRSLLGGLLPAGSRIVGVARTRTAPAVVTPSGPAFDVDGRVAEIEAIRRFHPEARTLLVVGAEKFARVTFGPDGSYRRMRRNSSCAAGTGSFLDQQAARLGLAGGSAELALMALSNEGDRPAIASRCSVFAKTDLIHAQAEGWSVEAICDGLCQGLARNIADTLFPGEKPEAPVFMAGGVSRNAAVLRHLQAFAGSAIATDDTAHVYGAIGAALRLFAARNASDDRADGASFAAGDIGVASEAAREHANRPLGRPGDGYPDFSSLLWFEHDARKNGSSNPVEVDLYLDPRDIAARDGAPDGAVLPVLLGVDVGSTSTKAALITERGDVVAGFYTWTAGQPLDAMQSIFEAAERLERERGIRFDVRLAATTGSGRKLVGAVIGADSTIDEITAHARAACRLDPAVDTIIEIGGQDSKFTQLKDGVVVFSQMNTVCAAGTGSFLAEQATRLGVPLADFAGRALGAAAPLTSDRCTVFMERDLNHFQSLGYGTDELLAASLHSVCDNYLGKVAREGAIGKRIVFQGATAKNAALVAAFERRLGKPVAVSKFCHLTGAIGAALAGAEAIPERTAFRGFGIHALDLVSRSERCGLCANHCRLRIVDVGGEEVAYGFLCGRDYATKRFVRPDGRDFLKDRRAVIEREYADAAAGSSPKLGYPSVGIPSALYLQEDAPFWKAFFERLGFPCSIARDDAETLRAGKRLAGAEFCAPMAMFHGQAAALLETCDLAFMPVYLEHDPEKLPGGPVRRYYCNYAQYASVVARCAESKDRVRVMSPLVKGRSGDGSRALDEIRKALSAALAGWGVAAPSRKELEAAHAACLAAKARVREGHERIFAERRDADGPAVVIVGRPYAALSEAMGKGIADLLGKQGVDVFYADMLPRPDSGALVDLDPLLGAFHWRFAAEALEAAAFCARDGRCYPVLVTNFKCSPDSFAVEWFRKILDRAGKPYLVLQIDDLDSSVGYETRVEAGLRSFRNHYRNSGRDRTADATPLLPPPADRTAARGKTVLIPNWDPLVCPLLAANLRAQGLDARVLEESPESIRRAMSGNTGQCIPVNIIARDCVEQVEREGLDPEKTLLWIAEGRWPCNLPLYPAFLKELMVRHGRGAERIDVYVGDITFLSFGPAATLGAFHAYTAGGTLRRLACRIRPYEKERGAVDRLVDRALGILVGALESGGNVDKAYDDAFTPFLSLETAPRNRPKVAIFGDLYSRDNDTLNQDLIRSIESAGGEVITTPYIEYLKATLDPHFDRQLADGNYGEWAKDKAALAVVAAVEKALSLKAGAIFGKPRPWGNPGYAAKLRLFGMSVENEGECFDNTLKIFNILREHPDVSLFVQANPAFCCPSIVTEAMSKEIERVTGVPVVTITYDGTGAPKNDALEPYLAFVGRPDSGRTNT